MTNYKRGIVVKDGKKYGYYPDGSLYRIYENDRPFITFADRDGETVMQVRQATELGYAEIPVWGCADLAYPSSTLRRSRAVGGGCRFADKYYLPSSDPWSNTISTVTKDNMLCIEYQ